MRRSRSRTSRSARSRARHSIKNAKARSACLWPAATSSAFLLGLEILEIWQALEIGPQMLGAEKLLEVAPAYRLRVVLASHCLKRRDTQFGVSTIRVVVFETLAWLVEPRQRLGWSVCSDQPLGDIEPVRALHPATMDGGDECVGIVLEVGQQREPKGKVSPLDVALPVTGLGRAGDRLSAQPPWRAGLPPAQPHPAPRPCGG